MQSLSLAFSHGNTEHMEKYPEGLGGRNSPTFQGGGVDGV
ncbi:hypothetical protein SAMN04488023_1177 [Pedobacter rhizosphaerae]|uniref:Uncharacterized protein n=1 Tax=Pedobacter rhizosphaerae TaxID=390241 RepID=A0A1H9S7I3_9SPHI|nr:hypothetical protein SAMN04488023_1177 [Pedobacter rhizosphaerae]